ncbi:MAG: ABC transporter permease, partial [Chloroflexi bacterium]|nr:ABC transporter permease [Chloroflexota bacterium]
MKKWFEPFLTAWAGIATHKLRSFLTILGIVIGVAAVISLMSIGKGAQADILARIQGMGSNLITISPGASTFGGVRSAAGSVRTLTQEDAEAIAKEVAYIDLVAPTYSTSLQLVVGGKNMNSQVTGVPPEYQVIQNLKIAYGAFFSDYEY